MLRSPYSLKRVFKISIFMLYKNVGRDINAGPPSRHFLCPSVPIFNKISPRTQTVSIVSNYFGYYPVWNKGVFSIKDSSDHVRWEFIAQKIAPTLLQIKLVLLHVEGVGERILERVYLKSVFLKNVLGKIVWPRNSQKLPRWNLVGICQS